MVIFDPIGFFKKNVNYAWWQCTSDCCLQKCIFSKLVVVQKRVKQILTSRTCLSMSSCSNKETRSFEDARPERWLSLNCWTMFCSSCTSFQQWNRKLYTLYWSLRVVGITAVAPSPLMKVLKKWITAQAELVGKRTATLFGWSWWGSCRWSWQVGNSG